MTGTIPVSVDSTCECAGCSQTKDGTVVYHRNKANSIFIGRGTKRRALSRGYSPCRRRPVEVYSFADRDEAMRLCKTCYDKWRGLWGRVLRDEVWDGYL